MANYNVSVSSSSFYDSEMGTQRFTSISPSSVTLKTGDTLTVTYTQQSGGQSYVDITSFASGFWNSTANARLYSGNSVVRTLLASSGSDGVVANFPYYLFIDRTCTVTAIPNADTTPDSFTLGTDVTNAERSTVYQATSVTVSGIDTPITASTSGSGVFTVNNTNYGSATSASKTVSNGDVIRVWMTSSPNYSTTLFAVLNLNGVTDTWTVRTGDVPIDPQQGTIIPLGITSGAIGMNDLRNFFGEPTYNSNTIAMTDLYRGGYLVPNITQNSGIPTSGTIDLADFYGSDTSLFWEKNPASKFTFEDSQGGGGSAQVYWNQNITPTSSSDIEVGYGMIKVQVEYRFIVTNTSGLSSVTASGTSYTPTGTVTTAWAQDATLNLTKNYSQLTAFSSNGNVTIEVRKVWNGSTYTAPSKTVMWDITIENGN